MKNNTILKKNIKFELNRYGIERMNVNTKLLTYLCNLILQNINNFYAKYDIKKININISPSTNDIMFTTLNEINEATTICYCVFNYEKLNKHRVTLYTLNNSGKILETFIYQNEKYY